MCKNFLKVSFHKAYHRKISLQVNDYNMDNAISLIRIHKEFKKYIQSCTNATQGT